MRCGGREHPPVPNEHRTLETKLLTQLFDLRHERRRIRSIIVKN
jgi:hypothetical protein